MFDHREFRGSLLLVIASTAAYGAVLACWRSPLMALYVAAKLPVVFLVTTFVVSAFCWTAAVLLEARLRYPEVLGCVFSAMATAGRILLSLAPIVLFFILTAAPDTGTRDGLRFVHASLMGVHLAVLSVSGTVGVVRLCRMLRSRVATVRRLALLVGAWLLAFALVGGQVGWVLRPLVGSPNIIVEFVREDALASNFLESVFTQIVPNLINKGVRR